MAEAEERDDHEHGERSTAHYSNQQCGDDSRVAECSQLNVVLRTRISSSPNRIRQVYSSHRKEMAITEGSVRGRSGSQVELSEPRTTYPSMLQGGLRHTSDVKEIASGTHDRGRTPRTVLHTNRSSYDFQAVRQKFETLSKCGVMQPVDFSVPPGQRSRSVHRTSRKDIYQRSHSATSRKSTVQSAPPSPGASRSVLDLSNTNVNLERRHSGNVLPFSPPSSVNRSSSSSTTASRSLQSSTNTYHKSPNFLLPDNSVGAAIAFFSQQSTVPKSYSSRRCDKESRSKMLKKSPQFSPHVANSHSSNQYSQQVPKHSSRLEFAQQQSTLDAEGQSTHNLDNWLQSVVTAKEMHMNSQDRSRNRHKSDNSLVSGARSTSSERYQCGDIWTQLRNRDQGCDQRNWSQVKNVPHDNSKITPQCNLATETDVILNSQKTSGKFSDWESTGVNYTSLTRDKSNFRDVGSTKDPPVIICITQDPEDTETEFLNLSQSQLDEELSTQHLPLSPRSSFGSVCSFKSSNADSAVDMNNPDEESSDTVISPRQNHPPVTSHSTISASEASAPSSPTATHLPEVLVSDHSGPNVTESTVTVQATGQSLGFDLKDLERIPRPWSPEDSAYSGNSDLSLDDTDEEEPLPPPRRKQSSWKIIRSIVRWSPFVQVFKKNKYPWIQLAGHQGNFQAGESGAVLKKLDSREKQCYLKLMTDTLYPFVPEYRGDTEKSGEKYIQLQDLLCEFTSPCVMDVKMGCRTYLEEELEKARSKPTLRKDMYKKMVEVDPNAPTQEEREKEGVTKARYLQWRDEMSSSVNLGFRIEGIKKSDGSSSKDFKKTKTRDHVYDKLKSFIGENTNAISQYIERLKAIRDAQEESEFFQRHEVISSSLLFVHDAEKANIWMIDFGKTEPLPASINIDHRSQWCEGNHEDGYLSGLDGLLSILTDLLNES